LTGVIHLTYGGYGGVDEESEEETAGWTYGKAKIIADASSSLFSTSSCFDI